MSFTRRGLVLAGALLGGAALLLRIFFVSSYVMSGTSMQPAIEPGDFLVAWRLTERPSARGSIVVLKCPTGPPTCLKRVVGGPGDRIEFVDEHLVLNGRVTARQAVGPNAAVVVPPENVYVMDERPESVDDSRKWGPVAADLIEARVGGIWFSLDWFGEDGRARTLPRVRWDRLTPFKTPL